MILQHSLLIKSISIRLTQLKNPEYKETERLRGLAAATIDVPEGDEYGSVLLATMR
jgi:hypothetical protein